MGVMEVKTDELLQPEILSTQYLIEILKQRGAKIKDDEDDRYKLLAIYDKLVLPKPQRLFNEEKRTHRDLIRRREKSSSSSNVQHPVVPEPVTPIRKRQAIKIEEGRDSGEAPRVKKAMISWP